MIDEKRLSDLEALVRSLEAKLNAQNAPSQKTLDPSELLRASELPDYLTNSNNKKLTVAAEGIDADYSLNLYHIAQWFNNDRIGGMFYSTNGLLEDGFNGLVLLNGPRTLQKGLYPKLYNLLVGTSFIVQDLTDTFTIQSMAGLYPMATSKSDSTLLTATMSEKLPAPQFTIDPHNHEFGTGSYAGNDVDVIGRLAFGTENTGSGTHGALKVIEATGVFSTYDAGTREGVNGVSGDYVAHGVEMIDKKRPLTGTISEASLSINIQSSVYANGAKITPASSELFCYIYADVRFQQ